MDAAHAAAHVDAGNRPRPRGRRTGKGGAYSLATILPVAVTRVGGSRMSKPSSPASGTAEGSGSATSWSTVAACAATPGAAPASGDPRPATNSAAPVCKTSLLVLPGWLGTEHGTG